MLCIYCVLMLLMCGLLEWKRVLRHDGALLLAVPDLKILATLLTQPSTPVHLQHLLMKIIFGGQTDRYDFHHVSPAVLYRSAIPRSQVQLPSAVLM